MGGPLTRRRFLQGAAALGTGLAIGACRDDGEPGSATAPDRTEPSSTDGTLVVITLYGGNDGLNTVVPVDDPLYPAGRGSLAIAADESHPVGEGFALHPSLTRCADLWAQDRLAVVHGVGSTALDRSHFHCMDQWQAAGDDHRTGWLGRWLDAAGEGPMDAIVVGRTLPLLARGARRAASVVPPGGFPRSAEAVALRPLVATLTSAERPGLAGLVAGSTADLLALVDEVGPLLDPDDAALDGLDAQLDVVATLIEADLPARVYTAALDGFDTHATQAVTHAALLSDLDTALGRLLERVGDRKVTVLVHSEFGRRVAPNASDGTDHGQAGVVLLAGAVRPGHHGEPPPLDDLDDGDLRTTIDYRAVYAAVLEGVLGVPAADIIDDSPPALSLV